MRHLLAILCSFALVPLVLPLQQPVQAQTVIAVVNYAAAGLDQATVRTIEADGNPATIDLLAIRNSDGLYAVARLNAAGTICVGSWFNPRTLVNAPPFSSTSVERVGLTDVLQVRYPSGGTAYILALTAPSC